VKKILVTGGCGYVGSALVPKLLSADYEVLVVDTQWFGNFLSPHKNLEIIKSSVDKITRDTLEGVEKIIHLANIANDPGVELNPLLSWEINVLHFMQLLELAKRCEVKDVIYASSGSVYGVKKELSVTEDLEPNPISTYNKTKMAAERVLLSYASDFRVICVRPATVCGISPRMRFDVAVNMFVLQSFENQCLKVFGGDQTRPNIHISDLVDVYIHFLQKPELESGIYNAGFENLTILEIAKLVSSICGGELQIESSNDPRSYRQDSTKLLQSGFSQKFKVENAIEEVWAALKSENLKNDPRWHTVKTMKNLGISNGM
jgi:nucleoside-diphosphate-sugar epimerase